MLDGYKRLVYIDGQANAYIDFDNIDMSNTSFDVEMNVDMHTLTTTYSGIFGNTTGANNLECWVASDGVRFRYNGTKSNTLAMTYNQKVYIKASHSGSNNFLEVGVNSLSFSKATYTTTRHLSLYRSAGGPINGYIFDTKVTVGGVVKLNLVPALRELDDVAGMYDIDTDTFYRSTSGYDFVPGPEYEEVTITITTEGDGTYNYSPDPAYNDHSICVISAVPNAGSVFAGWFNELGELITLTRNYSFTLINNKYVFKAKFVPDTITTNCLEIPVDIYNGPGKVLTENDTFKYSTIIKIPRVIKSFSDYSGAYYETYGGRLIEGWRVSTSHSVGNDIFNGYINERTSLTSLSNNQYANVYFPYYPYNIDTFNSGSNYYYKIVIKSTGNYVSIGDFLQDKGEGFYYDKDNNQVGTFNYLWSQPGSGYRTVRTIGFVGFESDTVTENTKVIAIEDYRGNVVTIGSYSDGSLKSIGDWYVRWLFGTTNVTDQSPDPYAQAGVSYEGGGDGTFDFSSDTIDDNTISNVMGTNNGGLITVYTPTEAQLTSLKNFLFVDADLTDGLWDKLEGILNQIGQTAGVLDSPIEYILNFYELPYSIPAATKSQRSMYLGWLSTLIQMDYTTMTLVTIDMGQIDLKKLYGNALDYNAVVQIYLPFIGYKTLDAKGVMGKTIGLKYNVDLYTGNCVAQVYIDGSIMYQFNGNMAYQLPLGSSNVIGQTLSNVAQAAAQIAMSGAGGGA